VSHRNDQVILLAVSTLLGAKHRLLSKNIIKNVHEGDTQQDHNSKEMKRDLSFVIHRRRTFLGFLKQKYMVGF
jgi:hypothetical protein